MLQVIEKVKLMFSCLPELYETSLLYVVPSMTSLLLQTSVFPRIGGMWEDNT